MQRRVACYTLLLGVVGLIAGTAWLPSLALGAESQPAPPVRPDSQPAPTGVPAYAPANSAAEADVVDAARLLGIPLARTAQFPTASPVAFFCASALADRQFPQRLRAFVSAGGRALLTSRLANRLGRLPSEFAERIFVLPSSRGPRAVLSLPQAQVDRLRNFALRPLGLRMEAPPRVSLALVGRSALILENHNPFAAGVKITFLAEQWPGVQSLANDTTRLPLVGGSVALQAPPRAAQRFQIVSRER